MSEPDNKKHTADVRWPSANSNPPQAVQKMLEEEEKRIDPELLKETSVPEHGGDLAPGILKGGTFPKGIIWGIVGLVAIFVASFGIYFLGLSRSVSGNVMRNLNKLQSGVEDLRNLDSKSAQQKFSSANDDLGSALGGFSSKLGPLLKGTGDFVFGFQKLAGFGISLTQEVGFLENNFPELILDKKGGELIGHLDAVQKILSQIQEEGDKISAGAAKLGELSKTESDFYLPLLLDIGKFERFLGVLTSWLKAPSPRHLLLLLENPSEIRPAGGFLGSYADLTLDQGSLEAIEVHDINDADRLFDGKIIPPKPLQATVKSWRAADANWFFDFPASAAKVAEFIGESKLYSTSTAPAVSASSTPFDGVIAVSPRVIGDLLTLTGPLSIPEEHLTLDEKNFLVEIQKKVQQGQATRATYPKGVLGKIAGALASRLHSLNDSQKQQLFRLAGNWFVRKDLMLYAEDRALQDSLDSFGVTGAVYKQPSNFEGSYLALVDANTSGGKSDIFIKQTVTLQSQVSASGTVTNHLVIDREHQGNKSSYWWYKTDNLDFLQFFVPEGSELINFKGGTDKTIVPQLNYKKKGYVADPDVTAIESSMEKLFGYPAVSRHNESGREALSTWSKLKAGEKTELIFDYTHRLFLAPASGTAYQFVFEKQAGTSRHYKFDISAPVGFIFKESGSPVYDYESDDPPGRLILDLTLEKI